MTNTLHTMKDGTTYRVLSTSKWNNGSRDFVMHTVCVNNPNTGHGWQGEMSAESLAQDLARRG